MGFQKECAETTMGLERGRADCSPQRVESQSSSHRQIDASPKVVN